MRHFLGILLVHLIVLASCRADLCDIFDGAKSDITEPCWNQLNRICRNSSDVMWQMFDASSKFPTSGLSYSNNKDLGNFDQCLTIDHEDFYGRILGKFCALNVAVLIPIKQIPNPFAIDMQPRPLADSRMIKDEELFEIQKSIKAGDEDYSLALLSICVPDQCTPREVGKYFIWGQLENTLVYFPEDVPCLTKETDTELKGGDIAFITFLAIIGLLMVLSTAYDFTLRKLEREAKNPTYLAFSIITNGEKLLKISTNKVDQIQCLNGLRFISIVWIISGHGFVAIEQVPLINYVEAADWMDSYNMVYMGSAPIAVDTFFFLSGLLLTYGYLKSAIKLNAAKQLMNLPIMYIHRYLRLTPALAVLFFAVITIFRLLGTGPLWVIMSDEAREQCENHWWDFFLYVQNYVSNGANMCMNHTWYLSADMQMFILAPLVLIPVVILIQMKMTKEALYGLVVLTIFCTGFPMLIRFLDHDITNVYDTHSRFQDYLCGVILGVILRQYKDKPFAFTRLQNIIIWVVVLLVDIGWNVYYHKVARHYEHTEDTLFYGFYRPLWGISLAWIVYSCYHGYGGPINWILCRPIFQIGAKLSYCMYLLHAMVEMYYVGITRTSFFWSDYSIFYVNCGNIIVTMVLSAVWTLAFELPMIVVEKLVLGALFKSISFIVKLVTKPFNKK